MDLAAELERRHANIRAAMGEHGLDALIVSGNEYSGLRGRRHATCRASRSCTATRTSSFPPTATRSSSSRPRRATSASTARRRSSRSSTLVLASTSPITRRAPVGSASASTGSTTSWPCATTRRSTASTSSAFDVEFDLARAVKSEAELESVRDSVRINQRGFELWHEAYAPGKTAAEVMAAAEEWFIAEGCGRLTMNMVLTGTDSYARPEFKIARSDEVLRRVRAPVARGGRPRHALGRGLTRRARPRRRAVRRDEADARGLRRVLRRRQAARCTPARPATTSTSRCRRGSPTGATTSATSPATRSG